MLRRFAKRDSPIHGCGVFALRDLAAGVQLLEYRGRRVASALVMQRFGDTAASGHTFLFALNAHFFINGADGGNLARWINHSCVPNCEAMVYVNINGIEERDRVFIQTLRPIQAGEELTFDYAIEISGDRDTHTLQAWACRCGSERCRGTMLQL
ncbi:MAG: SET domain-containing protein-lysine N-methyltransferase [Pseudomonadota bacterium]|nr:SET domain-containing protein-lysine N-methyltransferase [Pseudomonadota bacterium]